MNWLTNPYRFGPALPVAADVAVTLSNAVTTTISATAPSGIVAGDLLLLTVTGKSGSGGDACIFLTPPSGWTRVGEARETFLCATVFYKVAVGGEGSVTVTNDNGISHAVVIYYQRITGAHASDPINSMWSNTLNVTNQSYAPSYSGGSTSVDKCLGVNVVAQENANATTVTPSGTGWTKTRQDSNANTDLTSCLSTKTMDVAGNQSDISYSTSGGAATEWLAVTIAINPAIVTYGTYPVIAAVQKSTVTNNPTITMVAPSGIASGNMLVICVTNSSTLNAAVFTTPAGWTAVASEVVVSTADCHSQIFYKVSNGTEGNVVVTMDQHHAVGWYMRLTGCTGFNVSAAAAASTGLYHTQLASVWPTTTQPLCLMIGIVGVCSVSGSFTDHPCYGSGDMSTYDTGQSNSTLRGTLCTARAPIAGINASRPILHNLAVLTGSTSGGPAAVLAAFY